MIHNYTITLGSPSQEPIIIESPAYRSDSQVNEFVFEKLQEKHANTLTRSDLDVFITFFYQSLSARKITQLDYELRSGPNVPHSITIDSDHIGTVLTHKETVDDSGVVLIEKVSFSSEPPLRIPLILAAGETKKVCKRVLSATGESLSEYDTQQSSVLSAQEINSAEIKDPILSAFFNSRNLVKISIKDEYIGSDITEYTIDTENSKKDCVIS